MLDLSRQGFVEDLPTLDVLKTERQIELESTVLSDRAFIRIIDLLHLDSAETRYLGLGNTKVGKRVVKIANVLAENEKLEYLDLSFNELNDSIVEDVLLPALVKNYGLISLNLRGNDIKHRTLSAIENLLRRNQQHRAEVLAARQREQDAMINEEISVRDRNREISELVEEVQDVQKRRIARLARLRNLWAREAAKAEAAELQLLSALQMNAEDRKEGRKGKKGKKGKK